MSSAALNREDIVAGVEPVGSLVVSAPPTKKAFSPPIVILPLASKLTLPFAKVYVPD